MKTTAANVFVLFVVAVIVVLLLLLLLQLGLLQLGRLVATVAVAAANRFANEIIKYYTPPAFLKSTSGFDKSKR